MDRQFIQRYLGFRPVYQLVRRLHRRLYLRDRRFIWWCLLFFFLARFWPLFCSFLHVVFFHPWDLEMSTKTCWNNKVGPNDHVIMNHQNQTWTNGIWGHIRYNLPLFGDLWQHNQSKHKFAKSDRIRTTYTCLDAYHHPKLPLDQTSPFLIKCSHLPLWSHIL
jgi:hypothetical protein